jgi:protein gp37
MGDGTGISWTDATWNPVRGCSRVSEGCRHCYAERTAARFSGPGQPYEGLIDLVKRTRLVVRAGGAIQGQERFEARWSGVVRLVPEHLADPLRWRRPRRIFVNSMSDLFHEALTNEEIAAVFGVMAAAPRHTFQILTKRAERMRDWFTWVDERAVDGLSMFPNDPHAWRIGQMLSVAARRAGADDVRHGNAAWPLPNVHLGVSVENREAMIERAAPLKETPAAVHFWSVEPLIGDLGDIDPALLPEWMIAGCESGPGARIADVAWFRSLREQCAAAGVPFFLKQAGEQLAGAPSAAAHHVAAGAGSRRKAGGVIELPYLDGVMHAAFPEVSRG